MIKLKKGDIFQEDVEALVNSVNCVGVMGRGIALQFKNLFPDNFKAYKRACELKEVRPGRMFVYQSVKMMNPRYIVNFPTKRHWRGKSRIEDIDSGLEDLVRVIEELGIRSIAIPPLGTNLGGLRWPEVRPRIEAALANKAALEIILFEPGSGTADGRPNRSTKVPKMTTGHASLICLVDRYLRGMLDPFVTLLEVHKLLYFMQKADEPLRLGFVAGHYGPYSERLRHVLHNVEGHYIAGYRDGGDSPGKHLELIPGAVDDANAYLARRCATKERLGRVFDLVDGFETPFGLELLATAHWVATEHPSAGDDEVIAFVHAWNPRKGQFSERQITLALQILREKGWLVAAP